MTRLKERGAGTPPSTAAARAAAAAIEIVVLAMVALSPWAFGGDEPFSRLLLFGGVALLLLLWSLRILLEWRFSWQKCPLSLCLLALFFTQAWQLMPLPEPVLRVLSPQTADLYGRLLPEERERLPGENEDESFTYRPGSTISLYPGGARQGLVRLLALVAFYIVVRNNVVGKAALKRLSILALANGAFLALFAILQFLTSPPTKLYWSFLAPGQVFGPFICRNHFPFYVNLCVGLGIGLLFYYQSMLAAAPGERWSRRSGTTDGGLSDALSNLLQSAAAIWVLLGLGLILASVGLSLSRGGLLALFVAGAIASLGRVIWSPRFLHAAALVIALCIGLGLASWLGLQVIEKRVDTVWSGEAFEGRVQLWRSSLPLIEDFPLWGTGLGSFQFVEPLHRSRVTLTDVIFDHAHNEYLEALVEGGFVRLLFTLLGIGLVFRFGWRALQRQADSRTKGLVLGAIFGFATLVIHSFGEFGVHVPAIAILGAVISAQIMRLGAKDIPLDAAGCSRPLRGRLHRTDDRQPAGGTWSGGGLLPPLLFLVLGSVGAVLCAESWREYTVARLRSRATRSPNLSDRIVLLERAATLAPDYARLRLELGQAYLQIFSDNEEREHQEQVLADAIQSMSVFGSRFSFSVSPLSAVAALSQVAGESLVRKGIAASEEQEAIRRHLAPGLRQLVRARDLCPLLSVPHVTIATHADAFTTAEPASAHLNRAKLLTPFDPELWFFCGLQELLADPDQAWRSWRRSLELSDEYFVEVIERSSAVLNASEILDKVLPDRPVMLLAAAAKLFPKLESSAERRPFLEKALRLLQMSLRPLQPDELHAQALIQIAFGNAKDAAASYRAALLRAPGNISWRLELAKLLLELRNFRDAENELRSLLAQAPANEDAQKLLKAVQERRIEWQLENVGE